MNPIQTGRPVKPLPGKEGMVLSMRFIQKKDYLEVHNYKAVFPLSTTALGIGLLSVGVILLFKAPTAFQMAGTILLVFGILVVLFTLYMIGRYKYFVITKSDEDLFERNIFGNHKIRLDRGRFISVEVDEFQEDKDNLQYEVKLNYPSGKSYTVEITPSQEEAKSVADIFSFYFTKELTVKTPGHPPLLLNADRFEVSLYKRMRLQFPQGIPRMEIPEIDFLEQKKIHSTWTITFKYPPPSVIYTAALQFLLVTLFVFPAMIICHKSCILYGIAGIILGLGAFFTIWSLEGDNAEEIHISPDGFRYLLHHPTGDVDLEIPLKKIRIISIVPSSGYRIEKWNVFRKQAVVPIERKESSEICELYVLTDQAIIGIESPLNREMAEYIRYLAENSIYILTQKKERQKIKT